MGVPQLKLARLMLHASDVFEAGALRTQRKQLALGEWKDQNDFIK